MRATRVTSTDVHSATDARSANDVHGASSGIEARAGIAARRSDRVERHTARARDVATHVVSVILVTVGVLVATMTPARAGGADEVARAASAWSELEYERVVEAANAALASADLADQERVEALRLLGSALVILERTVEAEAAFVRIFPVDPDYALPANTSPRIRGVFDPARARWQVEEQQRLATQLGPQLAAMKLRLDLPRSPRGGLPIAIGVDLEDPSKVASSIIVAHRRAGVRYYTLATLPAREGRSTLTIPGEVTASRAPYTLELHVQVRHRSGVTLRREGEAEKPLSFEVAAGDVPVAKPIVKRWWFWAGIGVVAIGTGLLVREAIDAGPQHVVIRP